MKEKPPGNCQCPYCEDAPCLNLPEDIKVKKCGVELRFCPTCGDPVPRETGICKRCDGSKD